MSTDKENAENGAMEVEETSNDETSDTKPPVDADVSEDSGKSKEKDTKKKAKGKDAKKESKAGDAKPAKEVKSAKVKDEKSDSEEEDDDENDENEKSSDGKLPLLDQPLELSGTRERKKVTRFSEEYKAEPKDVGPIEVPEGRGTQLGNIPIIENNIQRSKPESLKPLHRVLFNRVGKSTTLKKNIRKFNGFDFEEESDQYTKKKQSMLKLESKVLKQVCHVLDLKKNLKRDELAESVLNFLMKPEDSGKSLGKPRPKRAARSNNKTYSESDEEEEERKSSRRGKKKHVNLKEVSSDEDDFEDEKDEKNKDKEDENASDVKSKGKKDAKGNDSEKDEKDDDSDDEDEKEEEENEDDEENSDDSDESKSKSKKGSRSGKNKKQSAKKTNSKKAAPKKAEKKPASKKRAKSDDESSEDEPLSKKSKNPPTDEEIKSYVKEILEGANLEETTMKIVCKKVYAHYPEFDLAHKKDFIKTTVKSLIST